MAQNITLLGASYTAVPAVTLPKTGGGTAKFSDASVTTAVASDVAEGKIFLLADGTQATGTASGGGGGSTRTTIVPEQTANYTERYNQINFIAPLVIGEVYIYTIDGVESQSTAFDNYGTVGLGSPDTTIGFDYGNGVMYLSIADTSLRTTHTIKIEQESEGGGGSATLITKTITANGTYSAEDDDADGYSEVTVNVPSGGTSGLVYETGTYTAAADGNPYISFTNSHASAPSIIVLMDVSTSYIGTTAGTQYGFFDYEKLFGTKLKTSSTLQRDGAYQWARVGSTGTTNLGSAILTDTTTQVTSSGFTPNFNGNSYKCKSGQTYKWIAIWAPTS